MFSQSGIFKPGQEILSPSFSLDKIDFLNEALAGYPTWQYVATLLWILVAVFAARAIGWLISKQLLKLARKTSTPIDDEILKHMHGPLRTAVFVAFVYYGIPMFHWPDLVTRILQVGFLILVTISIIYAVIKVIDVCFRLLELRCEKSNVTLDREMIPAFRKIAKVFAGIVGLLLLCENVGIDIKTALAGLGIGGLAMALAGQDILANFFGSLVIIFDSPYRVGENIKVKGHEGTVEGIGIRSTRIRTFEGNVVSIPNKLMAETDINNISRRPRMRHLYTLGFVYETTSEQMKQAVDIIRDIYLKHPLTHDVLVHWKDWGDYDLKIQIVYWCKSMVYQDFLNACQEINLEIKKRIEGAGMKFAFPTQTIEMARDHV